MVSEIGKLVYGSSAVGHVALLHAAGGDGADPDTGRQHQFHRVPLPGQLRRRRLLLAPQAHGAGSSAGLLQRDPAAGGRVDRPAAGDRRQGVRPHPDVRHRRLHRVHHGRCRNGEAPPHPSRRALETRVAVNGVAAVVCAVVVVVFAVAEFTQGAWVVVVVMPLLIYALVRTNRQYRAEDTVLEEGAAVQACEARILQRHVVVILIDRIDLAAARAIQYARTLMPDDLRAVHFNIDDRRAQILIERWQRIGLSRLTLDVIDCPDRRLGRAALELAAELADGETEVSMLLPRRSYGRACGGFCTIRRRTTSSTSSVSSPTSMPPSSRSWSPPGIERQEAGPVVPPSPPRTVERVDRRVSPRSRPPPIPLPKLDGVTPIAALQWRQTARIAGRVKTLRVQPWSGVPTLECVLVDNSGESIVLVFLGRRSIPGIRSGTLMAVEASVGKHKGMLAMINPSLRAPLRPDTERVRMGTRGTARQATTTLGRSGWPPDL